MDGGSVTYSQKVDILHTTQTLHKGIAVRGGRDNGPCADSFQLWCHFQGGGGWVLGGGGGGVRGPARGGVGGSGPLHIWLEMAASSR